MLLILFARISSIIKISNPRQKEIAIPSTLNYKHQLSVAMYSSVCVQHFHVRGGASVIVQIQIQGVLEGGGLGFGNPGPPEPPLPPPPPVGEFGENLCAPEACLVAAVVVGCGCGVGTGIMAMISARFRCSL